MKIIFDNGSGGVRDLWPVLSWLYKQEGTEQEKLILLANKVLPAGTKYELVANEDVPSDRSARDGWTYISSANEKTSEDLA